MEEFRAICKDCLAEFGYSKASIHSGSARGLTRPERCPACRRIHSRESGSIGIPQIPLKPRGKRKPDRELRPGRLGKIFHPERPHRRVAVEGKFGKPGSLIDFGITDQDIRMLIETMQEHQVVVVVGPTGSGKSTFLPYRLLVPPEGIEQDIFTRYGQIVVTQPRIQATRNIAQFVARDLHGSSLGAGFDVGFRHSGAPASDWRNKLVYITDGTLINWIISGQIENLSVIMIDEAHERSLNIDLILGLLKAQLPRYPHIKLIIASATINAEMFRNYHDGPGKAALLQFRGLKQHKIDAYFPPGDILLKNNRLVPRKMAEKIRDILLSIANGDKAEGDILGFLPGEREIETCIEALRTFILEEHELRNRDIRVYPLYTRLPQEAQDRALAQKNNVIRDKVLRAVSNCPPGKDRFLALLPDLKSASEACMLVSNELEASGINGWSLDLLDNKQTGISTTQPRQILFSTYEIYAELRNINDLQVITDRRVLIATNVAETSLTVDGIVYVIDSGLIKESRWDPVNSASELSAIFHSRAGCRQRWGRAGRVRDGEAHMLYTDIQFEDESVFSPHTLPEIKRSSLEQVVLKAKAAGIDDIEKFDWIEPPAFEELQRAQNVLKTVNALDEESDLTEFGMELGSYMTEVPVATLMVAADQFSCGIEMATLSALLDIRLKGGLLQWDRTWDFPTRQYVEKIHRRLARSCRDDLEFYLKLYSIWAEAPTSQKRAHLCNIFFISENEIEENVQPSRNRFLEMLSTGKKINEDRPILFSLLDRLRAILAFTIPEQFLFSYDGNKVSCLDDSITLPFEIDEDYVLAGELPCHFIALQRRVLNRGNGKLLSLSCLVFLKAQWLKLRNAPLLAQAATVSRILAPVRESGKTVGARNRLFLDIRYPVGARFQILQDAEDGLCLGELISLPCPLQPVYSEGSEKKESDLLPEASSDAAPLAGWEDKDDRSVAYADNDAGNLLEDKIVEEVHEQESSILRAPSAEIRMTKKFMPELRVENPGDAGPECEITGHEYKDSGNHVIYARRCSAVSGHRDILPEPGSIIQVRGMKIHEEPGGEKALEVKTLGPLSEKFIIDAADLTFSGRWSMVEFFKGREFEMQAVMRQGTLRLTRLPLIEKTLHDYLNEFKDKPLHCRLIEKKGHNLYFLLVDIQNEGVIEGAYMRMLTGGTFDLDNTYQLYPGRGTGQARETMPAPPYALLDFVEKNKKRHGIFWNSRQSRLHVTVPMTDTLRQKLKVLDDASWFHACVDRLYRNSNRVILWNRKFSRNFETGSKAQRAKLMQEDIPGYSEGEKVRGRIWKICRDYVLIILEPGGIGIIRRSHLCWHAGSIADPREVISADQQIEATVISQDTTVYENGKKRVNTVLSLLDIEDFPIKYQSGNLAEGRVFRIHAQKGYALIELEPGICGILHVSEISRKPVSNITDYIRTNQRLSLRIISCRLDPLAAKGSRPVSITLSLKRTPQRTQIPARNASRQEVQIPVDKIGLLIGKKAATINRLRKESKCNIWYRQDGHIEICGHSRDNVKKAIELIISLIPETENIAGKYSSKKIRQD